MKPVYRIFSRIVIANSVALLFCCFSICWSFLMLMGRDRNAEELLTLLLGMLIVYAFSIAFLTKTLLPVIKIDNYGIKAYSVFWKRKLVWEEIRCIKIIVSETKYGSWEEFDGQAVTSLIKDIGQGNMAFIFISKDDKINVPAINRNTTMFSHNQIAPKGTIAFAFEEKVWLVVQDKLKQNSVPLIS